MDWFPMSGWNYEELNLGIGGISEFRGGYL